MSRTRVRRALFACVVGLAGAPGSAIGQVATDGSLGPATSLNGPNFAIGSGLGTRVGKNLFHSFQTFNIRASESATFSGPGDVGNVLARVTGGQTSGIAGTLRCSIPGANLYLMNPAGVVFGEGASLDVSGSLVVTTADVILLKGGGTFSASNPGDTVLTSANPSAFGFLGPSPKQIVIAGNDVTNARTVLRGAPRQAVALVGGEMRIDRADVSAPGGRVHLVSVASAGQVSGDPASTKQSLDVQGIPILGAVSMTGEASVNADAAGASDPPGRVSLKAHDLTMDDGSQAVVETFDVDSPGPAVDALVPGTIRLRGASAIGSVTNGVGRGGDTKVAAGRIVATNDIEDDVSGVGAITAGPGRGGDVRVRADSIDIGRDSLIGTTGVAAGDSGDVDVRARSIRVHGRGALLASRPLNPDALGRAGNVRVTARDIVIEDQGAIASRAAREGLSGDVTVNAHTLLLDGELSGITAEGTPGPGRVGVTVNADELTVRNLAQIDATSDVGRGGQLNLTAGDLRLRGGAIGALSFGDGGGGTVTIRAERIRIDGPDGQLGQVLSTSLGAGDGGAINVDAGVLSLGQNGVIFSGTGSGEGPFNAAGGSGGNIDIRAGELRMSGNSAISAQTTSSAGRAGTVRIRAARAELTGSAAILSPSLAQAADPRGGSGGDVILQADVLRFDRGGAIIASTFSSGDAGNVTVQAPQISIDGAADNDRPVGIFSTSTINIFRPDPQQILTDPYGRGGTVTVRAEDLRLSRGAVISSESTTTGDAGSVIVIASGDVALSSGSRIATAGRDFANAGVLTIDVRGSLNLDASQIGAQAAFLFFLKNGGNVVIRAGKQLYLRDSILSAEAGQNGGNITIDPDFVILSNSTIVADAAVGNGGNINIDPGQVFIASSTSTIRADSVLGLGLPGEITITQVQTDLSGALLPFTGTLGDAAAQLKEICQRLLTEDFSSFVVQGRGGVEPDPATAQPAPAATQPVTGP